MNPSLHYPVEPRWYVIYVKSRAEKMVAQRLEKKNIACFLPMIKTVRQWSDRKKTVQAPLFNGYIFVQTDPSQFAEILMTPGAVKFIDHGNKHAVVRDSEIELIRKFLETGIHMQSSPDHFSPGEKVRIRFGPLSGFRGEVIDIKNEKHFMVRLEAINQVLLVRVPQEHLQKIQ